eukprot:747453-Hanusia_phi.AAC.4
MQQEIVSGALRSGGGNSEGNRWYLFRRGWEMEGNEVVERREERREERWEAEVRATDVENSPRSSERSKLSCGYAAERRRGRPVPEVCEGSGDIILLEDGRRALKAGEWEKERGQRTLKSRAEADRFPACSALFKQVTIEVKEEELERRGRVHGGSGSGRRVQGRGGGGRNGWNGEEGKVRGRRGLVPETERVR